MTQPWVRPLERAPAFVATVEDLAARVPDGTRVSIGGFHFSRQPIRLVEAIAARRPRSLTHVNWGGSLGLEILLEADSVEHIVFCFDSLEIFGSAPNFRSALESGRVTHEEFTALELHHALLAAAMNLSTLPLQAPVGSWRAPSGTDLVVDSPSIPVDTILLHAQRADTLGNLEIGGAQGLDRSLAFAGRRVLATVEEVVPVGSFRDRAAIIPRQFVEAIAVAPGGAWPTSCLPFYVADYREISTRVEARRFRHEGSGGGPSDLLRKAARIDWGNVDWPIADDRLTDRAPAADIVVAWLARRMNDSSVCSVGSASSLATIAYLTAKAGPAPALTLVTQNGGYIDVASRFASLGCAEAFDYQTAAGVCGGDDSYRWFYQQSRVTDEVVSAAQIDARGRTNNAWVRGADRAVARLPGQGGMADVANMHRNFLLYSPRQSPRQLVEQVSWVSASRGIVDQASRAEMGYGEGEVILVTDLAVFTLVPEAWRFALTSLHPNVTLDHARAATGFEFESPDQITATEAPTTVERDVIQRVDPFGLRNLEFLPARDRPSQIATALEREARYLDGLSS